MNKQQFEKKIIKHHEDFNKLWNKVLKDVQEYAVTGDNASKYFDNKRIECFWEDIILSGTLIHDKLKDKKPGY